MITPSTTQSHHSSSFCSNTYNKSATIPRSASTRQHPHQHQSKAATHRRTTNLRSSVVVGTGSGASQRALIEQEHRRSCRYTRTLDIILEEQQHYPDTAFDTPHEQRLRRVSGGDFNGDMEDAMLCTTDTNSRTCNNNNNNNNNTVITTDFWHSTRSMKKSANNVSLDSLLGNANEGDDGTFRDRNIDDEENRSPGTNQVHPNLVEDTDDDFDKFLDDWGL